MQFEFIDYDGGYPNLCFGRLKFKADGKIYEEVVSLISGGSVWFDSHWCETLRKVPGSTSATSIYLRPTQSLKSTRQRFSK